MDTNQWTQYQIGGGPKPMNMERKVRPQKDQALNCPRCNSTNTKFCYYNNYSLTQPRYFCKTCRRYWTEGGTIRNVPVGGSSRKNKRSITTTTSSSLAHKIPDLNPSNNLSQTLFSSRNPNNILGQDLNLGFQYQHGSSSSSTATPFAGLGLLRSSTSRGVDSSFMAGNPTPDLNSIYVNSGGFSFQDMKPASTALSFTVEGLGRVEENSTLMFPFGTMKQISNGYWNGMLGGGAW